MTGSWETNFKPKDYFEQKMGMDIYEVVDEAHFVVEEDK
jgi:hypothetical protein